MPAEFYPQNTAFIETLNQAQSCLSLTGISSVSISSFSGLTQTAFAVYYSTLTFTNSSATITTSPLVSSSIPSTTWCNYKK